MAETPKKDPKLFEVLRQAAFSQSTQLTDFAIPHLTNALYGRFEKAFPQLAAMPIARQELGLQIEREFSNAPATTNISKGRADEVFEALSAYAQDFQAKEDAITLPDDILMQGLAPYIGKANAIATATRLEQYNPELKGNESLKAEFLDHLNKFPENDRNYVVAATLKLSQLKHPDDTFEFKDSYSNLTNITSRLEQPLYNIAMHERTAMENLYAHPDDPKAMENVIGMHEGVSPYANAHTVMFNDCFYHQTTQNGAEEEVNKIARSVGNTGAPIRQIIEYMAHDSAKSASERFKSAAEVEKLHQFMNSDNSRNA